MITLSDVLRVVLWFLIWKRIKNDYLFEKPFWAKFSVLITFSVIFGNSNIAHIKMALNQRFLKHFNISYVHVCHTFWDHKYKKEHIENIENKYVNNFAIFFFFGIWIKFCLIFRLLLNYWKNVENKVACIYNLLPESNTSWNPQNTSSPY